ncbi:MAG: hypothetical protein IKY74_02125 [Alistipes sp.]|nr:hypothetical protein [Alistipes sp.]
MRRVTTIFSMAVMLVATMFVACVGPDDPEVIRPDGPAEEAPFTISVEGIHASTATTEVTPKDGEMLYIMYLEEVAYFQGAGIDTAEELWADDFEAFEANALYENVSLKEYMLSANILFNDTKRVQWNSMLPGRQMVLYVYGVEFNEDGSHYEPVTEVVWKVLESEYAPLRDISFDLDVKVDGAEVELSVKPEDWDGYYLVKCVDGNSDLYVGDRTSFDEEYLASLADEWIDTYSANLSYGYTTDMILEEIAFKGDKTIDLELSSYTLYSFLVFAIDEYDGYVQVVSEPSYINFSTEEVEQSEMSIDIEITNCYVRVADLRVTPTNDNELYALLITPTEYLPAKYNEDDLIDMALYDPVTSLSTQFFKGEITAHLNTLYPKKEYVVVAFGYSGGVITTDIYTKVFITQPEGPCEVDITDVKVCGPYRPSDLYNYDPERFKYYTYPYVSDDAFFVASIEVETSEPTEDIFADFVAKMDYDYYGEDVILFDLLIGTCPELFVTDRIYYEGPYYVCATIFDYKGNLAPMWTSELIEWSVDDIRPADELIAKLEAEPKTQLLFVKPLR